MVRLVDDPHPATGPHRRAASQDARAPGRTARHAPEGRTYSAQAGRLGSTPEAPRFTAKTGTRACHARGSAGEAGTTAGANRYATRGSADQAGLTAGADRPARRSAAAPPGLARGPDHLATTSDEDAASGRTGNQDARAAAPGLEDDRPAGTASPGPSRSPDHVARTPDQAAGREARGPDVVGRAVNSAAAGLTRTETGPADVAGAARDADPGPSGADRTAEEAAPGFAGR